MATVSKGKRALIEGRPALIVIDIQAGAFDESIKKRAIAHVPGYAERMARSRLAIDPARLLPMRAAELMDTVGNKEARKEIAMIKVVAPAMACRVVDRAIQVHGAMGVCQDTFLASAYAHSRSLRLADGPDEVHMNAIARMELKRVAGA